MRNPLIASALAIAVLGFGSAAYADSDGFTSKDQQQVYQTATQENYLQSEITGSIRAPRNAFIGNQDNSRNSGRDLTNTSEGN
jgi:hypothetical protein